MRPDDFLVRSDDDPPVARLDETLVEQARRGTVFRHPDVEVAGALARLVHDEFTARGTNGRTRIDAHDSRTALSALCAVLDRLHIPFAPPFRDFDSFHAHWRQVGASGSWAARRKILADLFDPVHEALADLDARGGPLTTARPVSARHRTGWTRVDEEIAELRRHFEQARTPQDHRNIGNDCVAVLERLSEAAYDPARHLAAGETVPPVASTKARLLRVVEIDLAESDKELVKLVRAAIEQAQAVKHRTPDRRQAGIAADSVILLAAIFRRLAGPA